MRSITSESIGEWREAVRALHRLARSEVHHIRIHASGTTRATVVAPRLDAGISIGEWHEAVRTLHRMARSETHH